VFVLIRGCGKFCEGPLDSYSRTTQKWSFTPKTNPLFKRGLDCWSLLDTLLPAKGRRLGAPGAAIRLFAVLTDLMPSLVLRRLKELESRLWDRTAAKKNEQARMSRTFGTQNPSATGANLRATTKSSVSSLGHIFNAARLAAVWKGLVKITR